MAAGARPRPEWSRVMSHDARSTHRAVSGQAVPGIAKSASASRVARHSQPPHIMMHGGGACDAPGGYAGAYSAGGAGGQYSGQGGFQGAGAGFGGAGGVGGAGGAYAGPRAGAAGFGGAGGTNFQTSGIQTGYQTGGTGMLPAGAAGADLDRRAQRSSVGSSLPCRLQWGAGPARCSEWA